jgi:two-component sensor histidine kinase
VHEVCRLHSHVTGSPFIARAQPARERDGATTTTRSFARGRTAPRDARRFVRAALGADELAGDAALIVSELATNAVVHAGTGFTVELTSAPGEVRVAVSDGCAGSPARLLAHRAHGLGIVATLAASWGAQPRRDGTTVWAALRR